MIKLRKGNTIVLGLSDENIKRLKENKPIKFNLKDLGEDLSDSDIIIFNGRDESSMVNMFIDSIGPKTELK